MPYAAAILAGHTEDQWRYLWTLWIAIGAAVISIVGVIVQAYRQA